MMNQVKVKWCVLALLCAAGPLLFGKAAAGNEPVPANEPQVGIFYFLWLGEHGRTGPYNISKIVEADPDAGHKPDSPVWGGVGIYHHWGEPLYG